MRARDVVGRTIVSVEQTRFWDESVERFRWDVAWLRLDNGKTLMLNAGDDGNQLYVEGSVS